MAGGRGSEIGKDPQHLCCPCTGSSPEPNEGNPTRTCLPSFPCCPLPSFHLSILSDGRNKRPIIVMAWLEAPPEVYQVTWGQSLSQPNLGLGREGRRPKCASLSSSEDGQKCLILVAAKVSPVLFNFLLSLSVLLSLEKHCSLEFLSPFKSIWMLS